MICTHFCHGNTGRFVDSGASTKWSPSFCDIILSEDWMLLGPFFPVEFKKYHIGHTDCWGLPGMSS